MWLVAMLVALMVFPTLLAVVSFQFKNIFKKNNKLSPKPTSVFSIDYLIPAHNEPEALPYSIQQAREVLDQLPGDLKKIRVGLSHWQDEGLALQSATGADEALILNRPGKWLALISLIRQSQAEWVILADAGVKLVMPRVESLSALLNNSEVVAINPTYQALGTNFWQKKYWAIEAFYKQLENYAGGPISLHGACIIYRREFLLQAVEYLAQQGEWIQDDVVIPLMLRVNNPQLKIVYSTQLMAWDQFPPAQKSEPNRRHRLLVGNLEWSKLFLQHKWYRDPLLLGLVARRWVRLLGSWLLVVGSLYVINGWLLMILIMGLGLMRRQIHSTLLEIFWASLLFPVTLFSFSRKIEPITWK